MIEEGYERVSTETYRQMRWWVVIVETTPRGPFVFARGGRAAFETECHRAIQEARMEASTELHEFLRFRPTHALGSRGELIPLNHAPRPVLDDLRRALEQGS